MRSGLSYERRVFFAQKGTAMQNTLSICLDQLRRYPDACVQDLVKALYQSEFGCGHLISDPAAGLAWLRSEAASCLRRDADALIEPVGSVFARVHLGALEAMGLSADTLFSLFALSSQAPSGSMPDFLRMLDDLERLIREGTIPLDPAQASAYLDAYREAGCPPARHSEPFRTVYAPAYRVVRAAYCRYLPLFAAIDRLMAQGKPVRVAIEGHSASGKSSLSGLLSDVYDCNVFHMDDFFLQAHQRTPERYTQPGGNVDYERFLSEVLTPMLEEKPFSFRRFDCSVMGLGESVSVTPRQLSVVEGVYSLHPVLAHAYDLGVFLEISAEKQRERILQRNGPEMLERFLKEWIPLEALYFDKTATRARCSIHISDA